MKYIILLFSINAYCNECSTIFSEKNDIKECLSFYKYFKKEQKVCIKSDVIINEYILREKVPQQTMDFILKNKNLFDCDFFIKG
jgi:hypothetical protein